MAGIDLSLFPVHLGLGATASPEPEFTGDMQWYDDYGQRHKSDGVEGRLVSMHTFREPWSSWERHPNGAELVVCVSGSLVLHQEQADGAVATTTLDPGKYAINPPGVWHTADVSGEVTALFITAGVGTQVRPR
jgi:quercetin dioxygenase-like cupin family protein